MIDWIIARLREPSTYAGLAGLAAAVGLSDPQWQAISVAVMGVAGLLAVFIHERTPEA